MVYNNVMASQFNGDTIRSLLEAKHNVYNEAEPFENGLGKVKRNDKEGFVNSNGEEVIPIEYEYVCFENDTLVYCSRWSDGTIDYYTNKQGKVQKTEAQ